MAAYDYYDGTYPPATQIINLPGGPSVTTSPGNHFYGGPPPYADDLAIQVPGPTGDPGSAYIYIGLAVEPEFTLEWNIYTASLPVDFTHVTTQHVFVGALNATGACAGLFLSKVGMMYGGGVIHDASQLMSVGSATQIIPGSYEYIKEGLMLNIRMAVSTIINAAYIFVTPKSELPTYQLRAVMPLIDADILAFSAVDRTVVSVCGEYGSEALVYLDRIQMTDAVLIPNVIPIADAGDDQAVRSCSIVELDGSASFDPEGAPLAYEWHLTDAPIGSENALELNDGNIVAADEIRSTELSIPHTTDPVLPGDIIQLNGIARVVDTVGVVGGDVYMTVPPSQADMTVSSGVSFKVLRQRGVRDATEVHPTFLPDKPGFYSFELTVFDGQNYSEASQTIVNVLESPLPRGCTPDLSFIWSYLGDFWRLVEEKEPIATFWSALAQVTASELYTLWQIDYSKSLRDIQRQFVRRWLHYDPLLAEPLPELTQIRALWEGVTTSLIPSAGVAGVSASTIVLSFLGQEVSYTFTGPDPFTYGELVNELVGALARYGFTIQPVVDRSSAPAPYDGYVRIYAPFPFTVEATSTIPSSILPRSSSIYPKGSSGAGVAERTYRTSISLEGLGVQENDVLLVGGIGYRILRVQDDASDPLAYQRITLKDALPVTVGTEWSIGAATRSELLDFYKGLVTVGDHVYFEVLGIDPDLAPAAQEYEIVHTTVLGVCEGVPEEVQVDPTPLGAYLYRPDEYRVRLAKVVRRRYIPRSELVVDVPTLRDKIVIEDEAEVLRRNLDFYLDTFRDVPCIRFVADVNGLDVWEGETPPDRLWAEYSYLDNSERIEANFGIPVSFTLDDLDTLSSGVDYLSAVRGLWYAYSHSPTLYNLRVGVQILLGLPFAEETGTIEEIRTDFSPNEGRILIRDTANPEIVRSYTFPRDLEMEVDFSTGERWTEGDEVPQFAPLVTGAEILDYVNDPDWFVGYLNQGHLREIEKFFRFMLRVDSTVFNLSALIFAHEFVLRVKPKYTYPKLVVLLAAEDSEIDVTDQTEASVTVIVTDVPCDGSKWLGIGLTWDDPRCGGGGWRNQYDSNPDPNDPPPVAPVPDAEILWGYDKAYLCPDDPIYANVTVTFAAPTLITPASEFPPNDPVSTTHVFLDPAPVLPLSLGPSISPFEGELVRLDLLVYGIVGASNGYVVEVNIGGFLAASIPFDAQNPNTELHAALALSIKAADTVDVRLYETTGDPAPPWTRVRIAVVQEERDALNNPVYWWQKYGLVIPAGLYSYSLGPM